MSSASKTPKDRVALVTGAARGIGRAIALHLLEEGWRVAALDRDESALSTWTERATATDRLLPLLGDVSQENDVQQAVERTREQLGELSGLVNNAGVADPFFPPLWELDHAEWRRVLETNLDGTFLCAKHALPSLRRGGGAIVNLSSTRALQSEANSEPYAASKGAIVALTHAMAVSCGPGVRVNAISPGWIDVSATQPDGPMELSPEDHAQHPVGRVGRPEDVAQLCAFLLSERASFITGQNYVIDGGMTRKMIYEE